MRAMVRTQISLTEEQMARLRAESLRRGVSIAQLIREAVDRGLRGREWEERKRRALAAVGWVTEELTDISERHDTYLADAPGRR